MNRAAPISAALALGPHSCASTVNATVGHWPSGSTVCFTPKLFPKVLNAKQGNSMGHFLPFFVITRPGIEPRSTAYKASTLPLGHGCGHTKATKRATKMLQMPLFIREMYNLYELKNI